MKKKVQCNLCGKEIVMENGVFHEDFLTVNKEWGYFSNKDIELHSFRICESCYDKWISTFTVPITKKKVSEIV